MNNRNSPIPVILVLYNQIQNIKSVEKVLENLKFHRVFISFAEFQNFDFEPGNTIAILFLDIPEKKLFNQIKHLSPGYNAFIAYCRNQNEIASFKRMHIDKLIQSSESESTISEKLALYIEIFVKENEIRDLSDFIEIGHLKNREQSTKIKLLSSTVNEPILIVNQEKKITLWNKEAQHVFGYSKYEVIQENFLQLIISDKSLELAEKIFEDVLSGKTKNLKGNQNIFVRNKLGVEFEINASVSTHRSRSKGHNFVFVFHDIQKTRKLEREIIKSRELWEETKILKEFVHHVTHELRTPMNSIIGIAKAIEKYNSENLSDRQKEGLQIIISSGNQLITLIKDLLDIARMDKKKIELNNEQFDLDKILSLQKSQALQLIDDKPVKFLIKRSPTVPNRLFGDHRKIIQILTNLIGNSVKFTNQGKIVLSCHYFENKLFFEVMDTGIGIRPEKQKEIFEKFTQADVSFSSIGTGLGLHISKKLIQLFQGEIFIESEFEKGTVVRFYVSLPDQPLENMEDKEPDDSNNIRIIWSKPNRKLILAIDDSTQNRFVYRLLAENNDFNLVQISNGKSGLHALKLIRPDLIILKVEIPELHGSSIIKGIRAQCPDTTVITLSEIQPKYDLSGVRFCLQDPINYNAVLNIISEIKQWPERKSFETVVIYNKHSWIKNFVEDNKHIHYLINKNPEYTIIQLNQIKTKQLIVENLSSSSNALNLVLRILSEDGNQSINEIILHNDGAPLKLITKKMKTLDWVKMLTSQEIQQTIQEKYAIEE